MFTAQVSLQSRHLSPVCCLFLLNLTNLQRLLQRSLCMTALGKPTRFDSKATKCNTCHQSMCQPVRQTLQSHTCSLCAAAHCMPASRADSVSCDDMQQQQQQPLTVCGQHTHTELCCTTILLAHKLCCHICPCQTTCLVYTLWLIRMT